MRIEIKGPHSVGMEYDHLRELQEKVGSWQLPDVDLRIYGETRLLGPYALGLGPHNEPLPGTHLWRDDVLEQTRGLSGSTLGEMPVRRLDGGWVSLVNIWSPNYFHWVLEQLTSLAALLRGGYRPKLIIPMGPAFIQESLEYFGYSKQDWLVWDGAPTLVEELLTAGPVRTNGITNPVVARLVRDTVLNYASNNFTLPESNGPESVYISRKDAASRQVLNEQALYRDAFSAGWYVMVPSELSLMTQALMMSQAKVIVAPHGAGLTNMVWAPRGCHVLELFGGYINPCYFGLASSLQHKYTCIKAIQAGTDMIAPVARIAEYLEMEGIA